MAAVEFNNTGSSLGITTDYLTGDPLSNGGSSLQGSDQGSSPVTFDSSPLLPNPFDSKLPYDSGPLLPNPLPLFRNPYYSEPLLPDPFTSNRDGLAARVDSASLATLRESGEVSPSAELGATRWVHGFYAQAWLPPTSLPAGLDSIFNSFGESDPGVFGFRPTRVGISIYGDSVPTTTAKTNLEHLFSHFRVNSTTSVPPVILGGEELFGKNTFDWAIGGNFPGAGSIVPTPETLSLFGSLAKPIGGHTASTDMFYQSLSDGQSFFQGGFRWTRKGDWHWELGAYGIDSSLVDKVGSGTRIEGSFGDTTSFGSFDARGRAYFGTDRSWVNGEVYANWKPVNWQPLPVENYYLRLTGGAEWRPTPTGGSATPTSDSVFGGEVGTNFPVTKDPDVSARLFGYVKYNPRTDNTAPGFGSEFRVKLDRHTDFQFKVAPFDTNNMAFTLFHRF